MPTALTTTALIHLYGPPEPIGKGERQGASFSGYHKTKVKNRESGEYEDHFTSIRGAVWGKEAEWLLRDGQKGTLVYCAGKTHIEKYVGADGKAGATLRMDCHEARIAERRSADGASDGQPAPTPARTAAARTAPAGGGEDDGPPFHRYAGPDTWG